MSCRKCYMITETVINVIELRHEENAYITTLSGISKEQICKIKFSQVPQQDSFLLHSKLEGILVLRC